MIRKLIAVLLCITLYTIIRYIIFGNVSPTHMPVYLLNKSVSMASVFFLFGAALNHVKGSKEKISFWGKAALHCVYLHILLSLAILSNAYYPKFFGIEKMNLTGETTILFGVLAVYCFWLVRSPKSVFIQRQMLQLLSAFFVAGHLVAMGFVGWLNVGKWHGGLPPISLVSFVFVIISLVLFMRTRKGHL